MIEPVRNGQESGPQDNVDHKEEPQEHVDTPRAIFFVGILLKQTIKPFHA